jgi:uncharacterized protein YhaN
MRLTRLDLKAVGPFTDRTLEFNSKAPGLHIIYGPNEAGKSSSLRALKALLYGFPQQTPDNFLHNYDQLLVGGCLENSAGEELVFLRRKKRIKDIIDEAGNPLPANALAQFLQGVEPEIFASLYGIDHDTLVRGGEEILAQKGEVGQALFAAGAGISSLREVIDQLDKEAAELFKSAGQLPEINKAIKRFKELQKDAKAASLSCKDWKDHQNALKKAEQERAKLELERDHKNTELRRLERLKNAIPELGALNLYKEQLKALGEIIPLPPHFSENHQQVVQATREAGLQLQKDSERLKSLEIKRQDLSFNRKLLDQAERLDDFHQRLGEYRKGLKDRPEREGMRQSLRREAAHLLQQVRPDLTLDELETLRPVLTRKKTVQRLSAEFEAINQQLILAKKQHRNAEREHNEAKQGLAALPGVSSIKDSQKLLQAVKTAQKCGDIDALLEKNRHEIELSKKDCQTELKRIGRWSGDLKQLIELPLPLAETVQQFEKRFADISDEQRGQEKEQKNCEQELKKAQAEIKKVAYAGEIPSEEALLQTRHKREHGWQLLRRQWLDREDVTEECLAYDPEQPLPEAYEGYVQQVDVIADRLRREADRVANAAALRAQVETQQEKLADLDKIRAAHELQKQELDQAWISIWQPVGVTPLSPKEMSGWLAAMDKLRYKATDIVQKEHEIGRAVQQRQHLRQAVQQELQLMNAQEIPSGDPLGPFVSFAETILETLANRQTKIKKLTESQETAKKGVKQAAEELTTAQEALAKWQRQWDKTLLGLSQTGEISTYEAIDLLDTLQNCFDKAKEAADLQKRIDGIDRDTLALVNDVKALLTEVAPEKLDIPVDQAILQMRSLLSQSQKDCALYDKLSEEIESLKTEVAAAEKTLLDANAQMNEILRIAKSERPEELAAVIRKFDEFKKLTDKISDTKANLAKIGAGVDIEEIIRQTEEINVDELPGQIESQRRDIAERIHPEINRVSQLIGEQNNKLAAMDGSARAAELTEQMEQELARIRRLAERYTLVKLASKILQLEIERYREEHQDPVLIIGSRYFREMTLGSFTGLRTDVDDKGAPVLIGMRPGDIRVPVEGMSSGTRDQLYLALRLATLEYRLESHEPMPFIVDDILINFDDERSRATLQALAKLSARNQVILFTHHQQIVDVTKTIADKDAVVVHTL